LIVESNVPFVPIFRVGTLRTNGTNIDQLSTIHYYSGKKSLSTINYPLSTTIQPFGNRLSNQQHPNDYPLITLIFADYFKNELKTISENLRNLRTKSPKTNKNPPNDNHFKNKNRFLVLIFGFRTTVFKRRTTVFCLRTTVFYLQTTVFCRRTTVFCLQTAVF
jgi:hypothetical protein